MHVGVANPRRRVKRSRHSWRMRNPQSYVSVKRPMYKYALVIVLLDSGVPLEIVGATDWDLSPQDADHWKIHTFNCECWHTLSLSVLAEDILYDYCLNMHYQFLQKTFGIKIMANNSIRLYHNASNHNSPSIPVNCTHSLLPVIFVVAVYLSILPKCLGQVRLAQH